MLKKFLLLSLICATVIFTGCQNEVREIKSFDDLKTANIGVWGGSAYEHSARQSLPDAHYLYFDSISDFLQALDKGKIDAFAVGKVYFSNLKAEGADIDFVDHSLGKVPIAFTFTKSERGEKLSAQMNEFLAHLEESGELAALKQKWLTEDGTNRYFEKAKLTGENGTLRVGTDAVTMPYAYLKEGEVIGYEAEILDKFCAAYGYDYTISIENFQAILFDLTLSKLDIGMAGSEVVEARKDALIFSNPHHVDDCIAIIKSDSAADENFLANIAERFKRTMIDEDRWKMLVEGLGVTILIISCSTIFGTALGFVFYMIYREQNKFVNKIFDVLCTVLSGLPTVVILLIFYYIIFGQMDINGVIVVIITFMILSSLNVMLMLRSGEKAIPKGQLEAALALGFSERQAFIKFILPQVSQIFFPSYQSAILGYMRGTAIVGYVAVQDLTRMADLIRARTFDAFVPIIVISIMYFVLSWVIIKVTDQFLKAINPRNRKREDILKGVEV